MSMFDLLIRGGTVVLPGTDGVAADIAVREGRIAAILAPGEAAPAHETLDAQGLHVLPGAIDAHLHLGSGKDISRPRLPADAAAETAAAAAGGVTTFIPYWLGAEPFETAFDEVRAVTEAGARIDFGYHFIISTEAQLAALPRYVRDYGVPSFKLFMNNRGGEGKRLGLPDIDDGFLLRLCEAVAAHGALLCPHPENIEAAWILRDRAMAADPEGKGGLASWNASRPGWVEAEAVQRVGLFSRVTGARLYVVHISSQAAYEAAVQARALGTDITIETCPHYLTLDETSSIGDVGKINPPLRAASDSAALWQGLLDGGMDTIGTDHVHRDISAKQGGIWQASPGCPGLQSLLPLLLSEGHHKRGLRLGRIAALCAENPARAMGLAARKGRIAPGLDADFAVVDLNAEAVVRRQDQHSAAGYSLHEGWSLRGQVRHTLVRGRFALREGALVPAAVGTGRYLHRQPAIA